MNKLLMALVVSMFIAIGCSDEPTKGTQVERPTTTEQEVEQVTEVVESTEAAVEEVVEVQEEEGDGVDDGDWKVGDTSRRKNLAFEWVDRVGQDDTQLYKFTDGATDIYLYGNSIAAVRRR